jgi:hypothetical protein
MSERFEVCDHITWNSETGHVSGRIIKTGVYSPSAWIVSRTCGINSASNQGCLASHG